MRKFIKTLVLAVMMGVSFTSCKKSEVEPETVAPKETTVQISVFNYTPTVGSSYVIVINEGAPTEMVKEGGKLSSGLNYKAARRGSWSFKTEKPETIKTIKVYSTGEGDPDWALFEVSFVHPDVGMEVYQFYEEVYPELFVHRYNWKR